MGTGQGGGDQAEGARRAIDACTERHLSGRVWLAWPIPTSTCFLHSMRFCEGSVAGAARVLELSDSAMSRTLLRLRVATGDPLLGSLAASVRKFTVRA